MFIQYISLKNHMNFTKFEKYDFFWIEMYFLAKIEAQYNPYYSFDSISCWQVL